MAEKQKKLKRKAHNLPIIPIMCQNIEEWFMWQSPCMTICCFMASECCDKYNFLWKRHKIAKGWWPNAAEWRIWFIFQFFHPWEHYKINSSKISSETWINFPVTKVQTGGGDSLIVKPAVSEEVCWFFFFWQLTPAVSITVLPTIAATRKSWLLLWGSQNGPEFGWWASMFLQIRNIFGKSKLAA